MKSIELPVYTDTICNVYPRHINLCSILQNYDETIPWILFNTLQLVLFNFDDGFDTIAFCGFETQLELDTSCPYIINRIQDREVIVSKWGGIKNFIFERLNSNYYIYMNVNTKYIKAYNRRNNFMHDIFISGCDFDNEEFICYDFFDKHYSKKKIPFKEIEDSWNYQYECKEDDYLQGVHCWKIKLTPNNIMKTNANQISKKEILMLLEQIENPELPIYSYYKRNTNVKFGFECYEYLIDTIHKFPRKFDHWRLKSIYSLANHIDILVFTIRYYNLHPNNNLIKNLAKETEIMKNLALKWFIVDSGIKTNDKSIKNRMRDRIIKIFLLEKEIIESIIHQNK
ncbi:hypothetical protein [Paenibacillus lautus]|uniref:hypothetical protein n=1 Tax=Paenibacillus lautus TaxID=1401 RepID=UPI003D286744